ncbi:MAG: phage antirepressor Ant [Alphaproteobacteria bacterium]|nr:MAG: phage antirepressor Ant [Alphaproteobacteria bacterium]
MPEAADTLIPPAPTSNTGLTHFAFGGAPVRVVVIDGEPWFVGKDVAERLGYANATDAMSKHCKGVAKRYPLSTAGGTQEVRILSEPDVLRLIVGSKLPAAEQFERWVFEEVLPSIRKTGSYGVSVDPMKALADPAVLRTLLATYSEKVIALEAANAELSGKAAVLDRLTGTEGTMCISDAAKSLHIPAKVLFQWMSRHGWIFKRAGNSHWVAYASRIAAGHLEHRTTTVTRGDGTEKITEQVRITASGLVKLAALVPGAILAGDTTH